MHPPPPLEKTKFWRCFTWTLGTHIHVCGLCTALSMHTCGCVFAVKRVSVYFSKAHFRPCIPLCCISPSLCHLLVFLSVWKPSISKNLHLWKFLLSRSFFLSSCLRTLPIWNPACDSSTRRGKRWSRLRAPCPQSPPPLSGLGGLKLRHCPQ